MKRSARQTCLGSLCRAIVAGGVFICASADVRAEIIAPSIETANEVSGVKILEPGKWGMVRTVAANRSDIETTPLILVQFPGDPLREFGTRVWMPPWSTREVRTPFLPRSRDEQKTSIEIASRLVGTDGAPRGSQTSAQAPLTRGRFESAIVSSEDHAQVQVLVAALRQAAGIKPTTFLLKPRNLPTSASGYEAIDSVFIGGPELELDPIRREALVGFLERGGRLWIMLDGVDQAWPGELLGDRWDIAILDSVAVTNFVLKGPSGETSQEIDHGVRFVRVCAPGFEVTHSVNESPAAMRKSVGRGQLVVTTLGARGWLDSAGAPTPALGDLQSFVAPSDDPMLISTGDTRVFDRHIRGEVGHEILGRRVVVLVLGLAGVAVALASVGASRGRRFELAAPASVAIALASGIALIGLGRSSQSRTASTSATDQLVLYSDESGRAEVFARTSVYVSPDDDLTRQVMRTTLGGTVVSDGTGSGVVEQSVWSDPDSLEITGLDLRPGAAINLTSHLTVRELRAARAAIGVDENGIRGLMTLGGATCRDNPLLVTTAGIETLEIDGDGALTLTENGTTGSAAVQSEERIARQQVARDLLRETWFPAKPTILIWSDLVETGIQYPSPQKGCSLRAIPVTFETPAKGSDVLIPAVLLTPEPLRGEIGGKKSGAVYDPLKRAWLGEMHQSILAVMQYRPPVAFGRIDVRSARLVLDLRAPGCRFDVVVVKGDKLRIVGGGVSPTGRSVVELTGDDAPEMDADGRILVGIDVHGDEALADGPGWSLQRMDLSIRGRTR